MSTKSKILLIPAALALLNIGLFAQDKAADLIKSAQNELRTQKLEAARETFSKVLSAADANASSKAEAHIGIATSFLQTKPLQLAEAIAEYQKALAIPELPPSSKIRVLSLYANAYERFTPPKWDDAAALYEQILSEQAASNNDKINTLQKLSKVRIGKADLKGAQECLNRAIAIPELKVPEKVNALVNLASFFSSQADYKAARETYQKMLETDGSEQNKIRANKMIAESWASENNFEKAIEIAKQNGYGIELASFYQAQGDTKAAETEFLKILGDQQDNKLKPEAFNRLVSLYNTTSNFSDAKRNIEAFLPKLSEADPNRPAATLPLLRNAMEKGNYEFAVWLSEIIMKAPKLADKDYMLVRLYKINSLGALGKTDEAAQLAEKTAADEKISVANKLRFKLTAVALSSSGKPGELKNTAAKLVAAIKPDEIKSKEKAEAVLNAAKTALMAGKDSAARELYELHESLFVKETPASYTCEFTDKAPADVTAWLTSPLLKDPKKQAKLNRKYGSNLAFLLETDASTTGRGVSAPGAADNADITTDLYMACDSDGLHFFFMAYDSKVADVKTGLLGGGAYEGYLAPGKGQAYYTFLIDLPAGGLTDGFSTMYTNHYFRQALKKDDTVKSMTLPTEKGFGTYLFYSWELFYDKLPQNGTKWQFENIRWTRSDGYSWAGSESVHNRSSWGDLIFGGLNEKSLREIKRKLIYKAFAKYKMEKSAKTKGSIDLWQDEELGDPQFYKSALAPLVAKLDEFGKKVTKDMSDADVALLFEQAVPDWMEFRYRAAELRTDYLNNKLFTDGQAKP